MGNDRQSVNDIAFDTSAILSLAFEWGLYGVSVFMYGLTIRELLFTGTKAKSTRNHRMAWLATAFLVLSTAHAIVDLVRLNEGLVNQRETFKGGPNGFFADATQEYFLIRSGIYITQTLLADAVVVYRCYVVWQSLLIVLFPMALWMGLLASSVGALVALGRSVTSDNGGVQIFSFDHWINAFFAMSLSTTLISTALLAFRIWRVNKRTSQYCANNANILNSVFRVVVDAGFLYSMTLTITLITFVSRSNSQYIMLDILMPIIAISFYMIILRVSLARKSGSQSYTHSSFVAAAAVDVESNDPATLHGRSTRSRGVSSFQLRSVPVQVHITQLTQTQNDGLKEDVGSPGSMKPESESDMDMELGYEDVGNRNRNRERERWQAV